MMGWFTSWPLEVVVFLCPFGGFLVVILFFFGGICNSFEQRRPFEVPFILTTFTIIYLLLTFS